MYIHRQFVYTIFLSHLFFEKNAALYFNLFKRLIPGGQGMWVWGIHAAYRAISRGADGGGMKWMVTPWSAVVSPGRFQWHILPWGYHRILPWGHHHGNTRWGNHNNMERIIIWLFRGLSHSFNTSSAKIFLHKPWTPKVFFRFEIIKNVLVSSFCFIWIGLPGDPHI